MFSINFYLPIAIPIFLLGIIFISILLNTKIFLYNMLIAFFVLFFFSNFIEPSNDHYTYLSLIQQYHSVFSALIYPDTYPYTGLFSAFIQVCNNISFATCMLNAIFIAGSINFGQIYQRNTHKNTKFNYLPISFIMINPMIIQMGISINKDILISLFLSYILFFLISFLIEIIRNIYKTFKNYTGLLFIIMITSSIVFINIQYLQIIRLYYTSYLIASFFIAIFCFLLSFTFKRKILTILYIFVFCSIITSIILLTQWHSLRGLIQDNIGRALIEPIYSTNKPVFFIDSFLYSIKGLFYSVFGLFLNSFSANSGISIIKLFVGFCDSALFILITICFMVVLSKKYRDFILIFTASFILLSIEIQIWGTPNYGNLFRQRIPSFILMASLLNKDTLSTLKNLVFYYSNNKYLKQK